MFYSFFMYLKNGRERERERIIIIVYEEKEIIKKIKS